MDANALMVWGGDGTGPGLAASAGRGGGRRTDANALMVCVVGQSWAWLAGWLGWQLLRGGGADAGRTPTH